MKRFLQIGGLSAAGLMAVALLSIAATRMVHAQPSETTPVDSEIAVPASSTMVIPTATTTTPTQPSDRKQKRLDDLAALLGISSAQLQTELQSGKPFYQVAAEHGVTYDKLKTQQDANAKTQLDNMVKVGYLTQDEANTMLQHYQTQQQTMPMGMLGGHGFHGFGFGR
ncbi:MAG: hypothetical protein V1778_01945 [bacterium]